MDLPADGTSSTLAHVWRGPSEPGQSACGWIAQPDHVAEELPVALVFNGISHTVMMASPTDLDDFALGFALSEGLLSSAAELYGVEKRSPEGGLHGLELHLHVAASAEWRLKERRRSLAGRTGCGLCGTDSLKEAIRPAPPLSPAALALRLSPEAICAAMHNLRPHQLQQQLTGATHAAAWANAQGEVLCVREDLGRHNALDKLLGALTRQGLDPASGLVCITSRASFEMVQKTLALGIGALAAVSAPTALAVRMAEQSGLLLCGFVRGPDLVAYSAKHRLLPPP